MATKNISAGLAQVQFGYQNAFNTPSSHNQPAIDRARGGLINIKLTIPQKTYPVRGGGGGQVQMDAMSTQFDIKMEEMPLVDTAGYAVEEEQITPDEMPYPYGTTKYDETFG